jgi:PncC family amidohydrolase
MESLSKKLGEFCVANNVVIATAESCTAGLISATIAMTPGSSAWLDRGFTVYTADAKHEVLGVRYETIARFDITSVEVAREMARGALGISKANLCLAVTGLAGPSGGTDRIPVGTVCMAWGFRITKTGGIVTFGEKKVFVGNRNQIREAAVEYMISGVFRYEQEITGAINS